VVSGSLDTSIRVWDVETGACRHALMGHQSLTSGIVTSGYSEPVPLDLRRYLIRRCVLRTFVIRRKLRGKERRETEAPSLFRST
jgi:hypothetical protein